MIKLSPLVEWKKISIPHHDPQIVAARENDPYIQARPDVYKDKWRGPHEGAVVELLISGRKPAAIVNLPKDKVALAPYIKNGQLVAKSGTYGRLVVAQKSEQWRVDKIIKVLDTHIPFGTEPPASYHAKLGILLGYSKEDILKFIHSQKRRLKEEVDDTDEWYYWWMDPDLKFHPVEREGHAGFAINHLLAKGVNPKGKDHYYLMYGLGWVRVGVSPYQGKKVLAYNYDPEKSLTDRQKRALNNWAKENDCVELRDNAKGRWEFIDESMEYPLAKPEDAWSGAHGDVDWKGKLVWMEPDKFLKLAYPIDIDQMSQNSLKRIEQRFKDKLPLDFLILYVDMKKKKVVGHEGRHRATIAKKMGVEKVPVLIYTGSSFERVPRWDKATHDTVDKVDFAPEKPYL